MQPLCGLSHSWIQCGEAKSVTYSSLLRPICYLCCVRTKNTMQNPLRDVGQCCTEMLLSSKVLWNSGSMGCASVRGGGRYLRLGDRLSSHSAMRLCHKTTHGSFLCHYLGQAWASTTLAWLHFTKTEWTSYSSLARPQALSLKQGEDRTW